MPGPLKLRLPCRADRVLLNVDFVESECIWSLSIEQGLRVHVARLRRTESPNTLVTVAERRVPEEELRSIRSMEDDPGTVSRKIFDELLGMAAKNPPAECVSFLRWRLCEAIKSLRVSDESRLSFG